jgi:hypothetical protein
MIYPIVKELQSLGQQSLLLVHPVESLAQFPDHSPQDNSPQDNSPKDSSPHDNSPHDISPHGHFAPQTSHPTDISPHRHLAPWTTRPTDNSPHGHFTPRTTRPMVCMYTVKKNSENMQTHFNLQFSWLVEACALSETVYDEWKSPQHFNP